MISSFQSLDVGSLTYQGLPAPTTGYQSLPKAYREASGSDEQECLEYHVPGAKCQVWKVTALHGYTVTSRFGLPFVYRFDRSSCRGNVVLLRFGPVYSGLVRFGLVFLERSLSKLEQIEPGDSA